MAQKYVSTLVYFVKNGLFEKILDRDIVERAKLELEFMIKSSPTILFQYVSTPSGLVEWFCDDVCPISFFK